MVNKRSTWAVNSMSSPSRAPEPYAFAAVHWPGIAGHLNLARHSDCERLLRNLESYGMRSQGYGALPYQVVACEHGVTEGRTASKVNGANGDTATNLAGGSIVVLIGTKDELTDDHKRHVLEAKRYLKASQLKTHNDVRPAPTACPGPALTKWIHNGAPAPKAKADDDMSLDEYRAGTNAAQDAFDQTGKVAVVDKSKPQHWRAGWNDVRWQVLRLKGKDGAKGDKGEPGVAGPPGASHSHAKVSVAGPPISTP